MHKKIAHQEEKWHAFMNHRFLLLAAGVVLVLSGCVKPSDPFEENADILLTQIDQINTRGYARYTDVVDTLMFVAASQAGGQIWVQRDGSWTLQYEHSFSTAELEIVRYDAQNRLWLAADRRSGYVLPMDSTHLAPDPVYSLQQFSDSNTEDFVFDSKPDSVELWLADSDGSDGLKYFTFSRGTDPFGLPAWEITSGEKIKVSAYTGMDRQGQRVGLARSELGIEVFDLPVAAGSLPFATADTPGEALDVTFYENQILVADNWAGMTTFVMADSVLTRTDVLEMDGWVKHIDLWNEYAFLSCAGNGLFVVKLSADGAGQVVDQFVPISYVYDVTIVGDLLYVASREGVLIYKIERNPNG